MSSGIVQLVAVGAQDEHITGTPEISFFNSSFKRHSNFSQSIEKQNIHGGVKIILYQRYALKEVVTFWDTHF